MKPIVGAKKSQMNVCMKAANFSTTAGERFFVFFKEKPVHHNLEENTENIIGKVASSAGAMIRKCEATQRNVK